MTGRGGLDRAVLVLGVASVASAVFALTNATFEFARVRGGALVVAVGLGLLAGLAGWLGHRLLATVAGVGFLLAALVLLVLLGARGNGGFLDGSASTFALWLGLGVGLVVLGLTPRDATT